MNDKPIAYIFHGYCELPTITEPYMGLMVSPNRSIHLRGGGSAVTRMSLQECGITIEDDLFAEGFTRVDFIAAKDFNPSSDYIRKLATLGLTRTDLENVRYREATELFEKGLDIELDAHQRAICPLYGLSADWDCSTSEKTEMQFHLTLTEHNPAINKVIKQIQQKDIQSIITKVKK